MREEYQVKTSIVLHILSCLILKKIILIEGLGYVMLCAHSHNNLSSPKVCPSTPESNASG